MQLRSVQSEADWERAKLIRQRVFIEEQGCPPEEEWDAYDETSRHVLGFVGEVPVATARWRTALHDGQLVAKLERFALLPDYRGLGYGRALVEHVVDDARQAGFHTFLLHAQAYLEAFYASLGFQRLGEPFMEAGIRHVKMVRHDPR